MGGSDAGLRRSEQYVAGNRGEPAPSDRTPAAMLRGEAITWAELRPVLAEAAGGRALEEVALDRLLEAEARSRGVVVGAEAIARERRLLLDSLGPTLASDAQRVAVLEQVRRSRGLGNVRFESLLRRNAILRALVENEVLIDADAARRVYDLRYGDRISARIITTSTLQEAQEAERRLRDGEPFSEVAARMSTDASAARGGIIEPVHPSDASYPAAIRQALLGAADGRTTPPVALEQGYAILRREGVHSSGAPSFEEVEAAMEREARLVQERALMDRLARSLLESAGLTVLDGSLGWSWSNRTGIGDSAGR